ncbi:MAG TPA: TrpB-like pyridoxal phosphate-dependent enzyme [Fastidiosipila sp.]|nr:TrpB-like pyridoxal phosphate-dependent enzyme [Fastidiosipila sp.]
MKKDMPYKTYLAEAEMPHAWLNIKADLPSKPAPLLNPGTNEPLNVDELAQVFSYELAKQELDSDTRLIPIPDEIADFYLMYRPTPLVRAYCLEKALDTPARIFYKYEGVNTSGSHKLNSAIVQAYYAKQQGLKGLTTETGAGQWGTALAMAAAYMELDLKVFMVKCSAEQKPYRKIVMETYGADVYLSPSRETKAGQKMLEDDPDCSGSLGTAISEAVEYALQNEGYRYSLGSVLDQVLLHQSIIGLETEAALNKLGVTPDVIIGCAGGGSNLGGLIAPFIKGKVDQTSKTKIIAVEPESCPSLTKGEFRYDFCDLAKITPLAMMYTLGHDFIPAPGHAGGLRFHGMSPIISKLYHDGYLDEARAISQHHAFESAVYFAKHEGILPAPESAHAIAIAIDEAKACKESGEEKNIVFGLTGNGSFDLSAYDQFRKGMLS